MTDHQHLVRCIEDSANFYLVEHEHTIIVIQINVKEYFYKEFKNESERGQVLASAVRWMLDLQYGVKK